MTRRDASRRTAEPAASVRIDRTNERFRYQCPNGHTTWDRTNGHVWCPSCRRVAERGRDVGPEHDRIVDAKRDEAIPWERVEVAA